MKIKENSSWKDRLIIWLMKLILFSIPAIWTEWALSLGIKMNNEIIQTGEANWATIINLFIVLLFDIKFLRDIFKRDFKDD